MKTTREQLEGLPFVKQLIKRFGKGRPEQIIEHKGYWLHVDTPETGATIAAGHVLIQGFVVVKPDVSVALNRVENDSGEQYALLSHTRADLAVAFPDMSAYPFQSLVRASSEASNWKIVVAVNGTLIEHQHDFRFDKQAATQFETAKAEKLKAIEPLLKDTYPLEGNRYNALTEGLKEQGGVKPTGNISAHSYGPKARTLMDTYANGWILDNGCGLRDTYYPRIVNYEIVDYPTTDVLGIGEELPFRDNMFDAVFSLNVLEHVRDPFQCAREIYRVLKPGGVVYAAVPFLQPFHGYPNHYYNMTSEGLKNLFKSFQLESSGVLEAGQPIFSLSWFLRSYLAGLPPEEASAFSRMRVSDLIEDPVSFMQQPFVTSLSEEAKDELASVNFVIARKPEAH